jgi:hypothetical protein
MKSDRICPKTEENCWKILRKPIAFGVELDGQIINYSFQFENEKLTACF